MTLQKNRIRASGDGATDMNGNSNVTIAYCRYNQTQVRQALMVVLTQ